MWVGFGAAVSGLLMLTTSAVAADDGFQWQTLGAQTYAVSCGACHQPHGSSNPRLLRRSNINLLCLECHTFTVDAGAPAIPSFHNQAQKYQACTMCHVAIHGSNSDHFFFKP